MWPISVPWISLINGQWERSPAWSLREAHEALRVRSFHFIASRVGCHSITNHICDASRHNPTCQYLDFCLACVFLQSDCEWSSARAASRQNGSDIQHRGTLTRLRGGSFELKARRVRSPNEEGRSPSSGNKIERKWYLSELPVFCSREVGESPLFYIRRLGCRDNVNVWNSHRFQKSPTKT